MRAYFWKYPSCAPLSWGGTGANDKKREAWKCNWNAGWGRWEGGRVGKGGEGRQTTQDAKFQVI